jgi:hypothetical protein
VAKTVLRAWGAAAGILLFGAACFAQAQQGSIFTSGVVISNQFVEIRVWLPTQNLYAGLDSAACEVSFDTVRVRVPVAKADSANSGADNPALLPDDARAYFFSAHQPFNCGQSYVGVVNFDITIKTQPAKAKFEDDAVKLDPKHNTVMLENDQVRVVHIHFPPGESGPIVDKRNRIITALTTSHAMVMVDDGRSRAADMSAGTIAYSTAGRQATLNAGTTPLDNIVGELKGK